MWIPKTQVALVCGCAIESKNLKVNLKLWGYSRVGVNQEWGFIQMWGLIQHVKYLWNAMKHFFKNLPMWIPKTQVALVCGGAAESENLKVNQRVNLLKAWDHIWNKKMSSSLGLKILHGLFRISKIISCKQSVIFL